MKKAVAQPVLRHRIVTTFHADSEHVTTDDVIEMLFGTDAGNHAGDHAAYAASRPLAADPGSLYTYSSGTTNLIARLVSRALGEKLGSNERMLAFMESISLSNSAASAFIFASPLFAAFATRSAPMAVDGIS